MSSNQKFKITKFTILKALIFLSLVILMIYWTKHTTKEFASIWKKSNNINPIKCSLYGEIDSLGREGRTIFISIDKDKRFLIQPKLFEDKNREYNLSDIFSMINVGDSLIKDSNSQKLLVKKRNTNDSIFLYLYRMNYGNLPCTPVLSQ